MNERIRELAEQAGYNGHYATEEFDVERFAHLVAAAEREACALTCEGISMDDMREDSAAQDCAAAIRARGEE